MTHDELEKLADDCERRDDAGEKPNPELWNGRVCIVPRSRESDLGVFVWLPGDAEDIFSERIWQDEDPAAQLFAEAMLRRFTAPLHAPALRPMSELPTDHRSVFVYDARLDKFLSVAKAEVGEGWDIEHYGWLDQYEMRSNSFFGWIDSPKEPAQ